MNNSAQKAQSIVGTNKGMNNGVERPELDFYPTPRRGTTSLLNVESFDGEIWECACGDGMMSKVLEEKYKVISTDIEPRGYGNQLDFLTSTNLLAQNIVTNPPFILAQEFSEHALGLGCNKLALLCKLAFLEGIERSTWLETTPLKFVYVFKKRLKFTRNGDEKIKGGGMIAFAWFIWERQYSQEPVIRWL
jgi:methylase of polypeptide subunit release factors